MGFKRPRVRISTLGPNNGKFRKKLPVISFYRDSKNQLQMSGGHLLAAGSAAATPYDLSGDKSATNLDTRTKTEERKIFGLFLYPKVKSPAENRTISDRTLDFAAR